MNNANDINSNPNGRSITPLSPVGGAVTGRHDPYFPSGRYPQGPFDDGPGFANSLRDYFRIFNKRRWLIISTVAAVLALGTLRTLTMTPMYTSSVRLQIDRNVAKAMDRGNVSPVESNDLEFLKTQNELLQSHNLAERVVSAARLADDADFLKPKDFSIFGSLAALLKSIVGSAEPKKLEASREAIEQVLENRTVKPLPGSRLVDVSYTDPSPLRAQKIAQAFGEGFINSNLDKRFEANSYAKTFLEDQIQQLKIRLQESEKVLLDFAEKEQIIIVNDKSNLAENDLSNANGALATIVSERIKNEQLWRQAQEAGSQNMTQILSNSVIDGLRKQRGDLFTQYQEKLQVFKPGYPAMVQIKNKMDEIDRQLAAESNTVRSSLKAAYESSLSQENAIKARISTLRDDILSLQKRSIQHNILKREVDTNQDLYNGLLQRFKEVDVAGGAEANNVFVVDKAELPQHPSSPKVLQSILLSLMLGLGLGLGAAYVLEGLDDVIVSIEDVERLAGLTTLGIIPVAAQEGEAELELADPRSPISEAYRSLCTSLQFTTDRGLPKSITLTSSGPGEGKSLTSIAISQHFARMGLKVLLIDGDLRNPSLHKKLGTDNSLGLSNYLTGACTPQLLPVSSSRPLAE